MINKYNVLYSTDIIAYANAKNYPNVQIGDTIELVEEDAAYMEPAHREQYGTIMVVDRMLGTDILGTIVVPGVACVNDDPRLSDTYFNR